MKRSLCLLTIGFGLLAVVVGALAVPWSAESSGYIAHEWGTFTSVQGADGEQMIWNPRSAAALPRFVYNPIGRGNEVVSPKVMSSFRQRMETPVIYFYSSQARTVDVAVKFPGGNMTEWFPQSAGANFLRSDLRWPGVRIAAPSETAKFPLLTEPEGSHYYAARGTEANLVQVGQGKTVETEKFLFYRGVGSFVAPLKVTMPTEGLPSLNLENTGGEPLSALFVCQVQSQGPNSPADPVIRFQRVNRLDPAQKETVALNLASSTQDQSAALVAQLREALTKDGLYPAEAAAMVKTWQDSWFAEPGLRVLYLLPQPWTDRILPLTLAPAPKSTARVMVGRAEIITPATELTLDTEAARFLTAPETERTASAIRIRALGLGRFTEAALTRFDLRHSEDRALREAAYELAALAAKQP